MQPVQQFALSEQGGNVAGAFTTGAFGDILRDIPVDRLWSMV
jgi:hypothetical protein